MELQNVLDYTKTTWADKNLVAGASIYLILFFTFCAYSPVTAIFFSKPDDPWMLLKSEKVILDLDWKYIIAIFDPSGEIQYSPLNTLYYSLIYKINGFDPYYFHLSALVLHCVNSLLVYLASKKLLHYFKIGKADVIAYTITFLWSIHPLNVESVVWISASKVLLFGFFTLLSLISFLNGIEKQKVSSFLLVVFGIYAPAFVKNKR
ncbi:hypothetical protein LWM68_28920 [Niabella sp. W65]|nr:hypothetical protein [Niabella sp. W65]MCH7366438.1 hypothetical protein [Niabella sp. W65]